MFKKEKIATLCLMAGMFFNPFGFDAILLIAMKLTNGYWNAIILLYSLVALFAILYYYYRKNFYLMMALFVNPLGYDALFAWTMKQSGSFLYANLFFYSIALIFFSVYFYLSKLHPVKYAKGIINPFYLKIRNFL
jgi:hypothetical protein